MLMKNAGNTGPIPIQASRRDFLRLSLGALSGASLFTALPLAARPALAGPVHGAAALAGASDCVTTTLWYARPAREANLLREGLAIGNGHLGALVAGDPARDWMYFTDASLWQGGINDTLDKDGQFAYDVSGFGSFALMARLLLQVPAHGMARVSGYRRELDLELGCARVSYKHDGVTYRREAFASHPDRVIVLRLTQDGGGHYEGTLDLLGTHNETTRSRDIGQLILSGSFDNGLRHAACIDAVADSGRVMVQGSQLRFEGCEALICIIAAGTDYDRAGAPKYRNEKIDPTIEATTRVTAAMKKGFAKLREDHLADHGRLFDAMTVDLGPSTPAQRCLDTAARLAARTRSGVPDPELETMYLQFGRYLAIAGSRDGLPTNLQGLWVSSNHLPWFADYHSDINIQMNYWLPDRAGLGTCFEALANYCLSQLPVWSATTQRLFNDPRNRFRNSSGRVAGWAIAFSTNIYGGDGWWWHPAGNAWLCNNLWQHYEYTLDRAYLARIHPLLQGACAFWQARLLEITMADPVSGATRRVLIDDHDWSPEHGPQDTRGITYAQELVWDLFGHYVQACRTLGRDADQATIFAGLCERLYLPQVSPKSGELEEWMSPDSLGEPEHRHLSPLFGLFPGDRITVDSSHAPLVDGARKLLEARGMDSYGWSNAWRAACWARLKDGERAYQLLATNLAPWNTGAKAGSGTSINLFDIYLYSDGKGPPQGIFQIDANFGTPTAMLEMLLYSRPGRIELLPALPRAWPTGRISGIGARGGFVVDLAWRDGRLIEASVRSTGGTETELVSASKMLPLRLVPGQSVTLHVDAEGVLQLPGKPAQASASGSAAANISMPAYSFFQT